MISIVLLILAGICNSIMDTCQHHYWESIFKNLDNHWWNGEQSWRNKYIYGKPSLGRRKIKGTNIDFPVQLTDAFHFFKMWMIFFICAAIALPLSKDLNLMDNAFYSFSVVFVGLGTLWNVFFSLFYNKILKR